MLTELYDKINQKQFDIDYSNHILLDSNLYNKNEGKVQALQYVKKLIAEMLEDEDMIEDVKGSHITLGKEWEDDWNGELE